MAVPRLDFPRLGRPRLLHSVGWPTSPICSTPRRPVTARPPPDLLPARLRRAAQARRRAHGRRVPEHTLQPTALVHEAYLRLVGRGDDQRWDGRGHFFAAAAEGHAPHPDRIRPPQARAGTRAATSPATTLTLINPRHRVRPHASSPSTRPSAGSRSSSPGPRKWSSSATSLA